MHCRCNFFNHERALSIAADSKREVQLLMHVMLLAVEIGRNG